MGLGLLVSSRIVKKLGGTIGFISVPKKGSSFYFDFELESIEQISSPNFKQDSLE